MKDGLLGQVNGGADAVAEGGEPRCPLLRAIVFAGQTGHSVKSSQLIWSNWAWTGCCDGTIGFATRGGARCASEPDVNKRVN